MRNKFLLLWILTWFLAACDGPTRSLPTVTKTSPTSTRTPLTAADLTSGFTFDNPLDESTPDPACWGRASSPRF